MDPSNPYATPRTAASAPPGIAEPYFRDGKHLAIRVGSEITGVCPVSNEPLAPDAVMKARKVSWVAPWVYLTLMLALIVAPRFGVSGSITYGLAPKIANRVRALKWLSGGLFAGGIAIIYIAAYSPRVHRDQTGPPVIAGIIAELVGLITMSMTQPLRLAGYRKGWFLFEGCSPAFLNSLPSHSIRNLC